MSFKGMDLKKLKSWFFVEWNGDIFFWGWNCAVLECTLKYKIGAFCFKRESIKYIIFIKYPLSSQLPDIKEMLLKIAPGPEEFTVYDYGLYFQLFISSSMYFSWFI